MSTRVPIKNAIQDVIKNATGVKKVFTYRPKLLQQTDFPSVVITLPQSKEERLSASAPIGKKIIEYRAQLEVTMIDVTNDGSGTLVFDDILDAIDVELRKDPTFGGKVLGAAIDNITTMMTAPQLVGTNIALLAIKSFDVKVQVTG